MTHYTWHVTCDTWHMILIYLFLLFLSLVPVLISAHIEGLSVSRMRNCMVQPWQIFFQMSFTACPTLQFLSNYAEDMIYLVKIISLINLSWHKAFPGYDKIFPDLVIRCHLFRFIFYLLWTFHASISARSIIRSVMMALLPACHNVRIKKFWKDFSFSQISIFSLCSDWQASGKVRALRSFLFLLWYMW